MSIGSSAEAVPVDLRALVRDYGDVDAEYLAAREAVALFDFSFMSRARLSGVGALSCLNGFQGRGIDALPVGRIAYCLHTDARSIVTSDLTVWNFGADTFDVYSGDPRDVAWLVGQGSSDVAIEDLSDSTAIFALQGPGRAVPGRPRRSRVLRIQVRRRRRRAVRRGPAGLHGGEGRRTDCRPRSRRNSVACTVVGGTTGRIRCGRPAAHRGRVHPLLGLGRFAPRVGTVERVRLTGFRCNGVLETEPWRPQGSPVLPVSGEITITSACRDGDGGVLGLGFVPAGEASPGAVAVDRTGRFGPVRQVPMPVHDPAKARPRGPWR